MGRKKFSARSSLLDNVYVDGSDYEPDAELPDQTRIITIEQQHLVFNYDILIYL